MNYLFSRSTRYNNAWRWASESERESRAFFAIPLAVFPVLHSCYTWARISRVVVSHRRSKASSGGRQSKGCSRANRRVVRVITSVRVNQRVEYDQSWTGMSLNSSHCQMHLRRGVFAFGAGISRGPCTTSDIRLLAIVNFRKRYFGSIFVRVWPCCPNLWEQTFVVFCGFV